ncbi:MAG TPA: hypothetical protein DDX04_05740 [Massilia sp.]|nr:hypothetical protein [Massilia sp.]
MPTIQAKATRLARRARLTRWLGRGLETHIALPVFAVLLLAAMWLLTLRFVGSEHEAAAIAAHTATQERLDTYEAQMARSLNGIDQTLKVLKYAVETKGTQGAIPALREQGLLPPGLVFVVAGMAFKLGAVPFHMWAPDVYQGAPTAVTLLLGGAPKLAAFAMLMRVLVEGLPSMAADWQQMLMVLAVLSLAIGNLTAIAQTNIKRLLAYSSIAQMGYVLLAMMAGVVGGDTSNMSTAYSAAMYSSITYVLTTLGSFGLIMMLARSGFEAEQIADFKGLGRRSPWFAIVMTVLMFSLAGVPPMMGFMAKWAVLQAVANTGMIWLAVVAVLFSLIGAFYYLRVVKTMWFDEAADTSPIATPADMRVALSINGIAILVLGVVPGALLGTCLQAIRATLAA